MNKRIYPIGQGFFDYGFTKEYFTCHICKARSKKNARIQKYCSKCLKASEKLRVKKLQERRRKWSLSQKKVG